MRLVSSDGAQAEFRPVGYQFTQDDMIRAGIADSPAGLNGDWDANWLVISGNVQTADGRSWAFTDPCLTTWEAECLSGWLHAVAGQDPAADTGDVLFTEPNLGFILDAVDTARVRIRVRFSHEALPDDWLPPSSPSWRAGEYFLPLDLSRAELREAADAWDHERRRFPAR